MDDGSSDQTVNLARSLELDVYVHDRHYGYGRNQQTCSRQALMRGAEIVIMVHPDYRHTPLLVTAMGGEKGITRASRAIAQPAIVDTLPTGAVSNLQYLDNHPDLLSDFSAMDDSQTEKN